MGKASSSKKVARLAERGKGKRARFQGGTLFPVIIAVVVVLGLVLITYSRNTSQADAAGPRIGDHWHLGYGVYICDDYLEPFQDQKETTVEFQELQIHSHGDGVMHWHPGNERAINRSTGRAATFGVFLGLYNVGLTDTELSLTGSEFTPPTEDRVYEEGKDTCTVNGKEEKSSLRTIVWARYDQDTRLVRTSSLGDERILNDQQVLVVAFLPDSVANADIPMPPWAAELPELGAVDTGGVTATTTVPVPIDPVPTDPVPTDRVPTSVAVTTLPPGTTRPATSAPATTTPATATT